MGTRGLKIVRYRGRFYVYYNQFDSYPEGWPSDLVKQIPSSPAAFRKWLAAQRAQFELYQTALEDYLTIIRKKPGTVDDGTGRQISCAFTPPSAENSSWASYPSTYGLPCFTTQFNDLYIEYVYTIDLDHEVFSVNNNIHFKLSQVSRIGWTSTLAHEDGDLTLALDKIPKNAIGMIGRPYKVLLPGIDKKYSDLRAKIVSPQGIRGFPPAQRHGALLCLELFRRFREEESIKLEHLLGSWDCHDFAFQEYSYLILCLASMGRHTTLEREEDLHSRNRDGYVDLYREDSGASEFVNRSATGCHLEGQPWSRPKTTTYWFEGALIRLVPELEDRHHNDPVKEHCASLYNWCKKKYPHSSIDAILLSVASVVLCKVHADGSMEHTECLPLFSLSHDYTINQGVDRNGYEHEEEVVEESEESEDQKHEDVNDVAGAMRDESTPKGKSTEVKMMDLFQRLMFSSESDESIAAGFRELQQESGSIAEEKDNSASNEKPASTEEPITQTTHQDSTDGISQSFSQEQSAVPTDDGNLKPGDDQEMLLQSKDHEHDTDQSSDGSQSGGDESSPQDWPGPHSSTLIPTDDGYVIQQYNADGTIASVERYRETVRNGVSVTERVDDDSDVETDTSADFGFLALVEFFDIIVSGYVRRFKSAKSRTLPNEVYRLIINEIEDMETYRACMEVSSTFRNLCKENFRLNDEFIFIANDATKGDPEEAIKMVAEGDMKYAWKMRKADKFVQGRLDKHKSNFLTVHRDQKTGYKVVAGNQRDQRILVPGAAIVFD